ncbi:MAG: hypothetical protein K2O40_02060, partial [Lachnospiraceae bacterium]|nr:hypothetical protein [Lachnospiraceae bacterium]
MSNAVRQLMRRHFAHCSPDYQMFIFLFQEKTDAAECEEYAHFPMVEEVNEELAQELAGINGLRYCYAKAAGISDHREGSDQSRKKLYWVMAWGTACEANTVLARIILEELAPKFYDMALFEEFRKRSGEALFFGRLLERKWLLDNYVQAVISANKLPDQMNFIQISAMPYEGRAVRTQIFFSENPIPPDLDGAVYFRRERKSDLIKFKTKNMRPVRKLMEVSGAEAGLWVKLPERVIEGSVLCYSAAEQAAGLCVVFEGALVWSIHKDGENILTYREGNYIIPAMQPDVDKYADLGKLVSFGQDFEIPDKMHKLQQIVRRVASECRHGTSIVFMEKRGITAEIDNRLSWYRRGFKVKPFSLAEAREEVLQGITAIDGAVFADLNGDCQAIGVIVDGQMVVEGDY